MERKLATIQKISELKPIKDADKIEVALMESLGWECVVKKGAFKIGDKVIYCEVDSVMPDKPEYEFLRDRKFRVKTIKLKGQISQGLILNWDVLPSNSKSNVLDRGNDVTELLGITKYLSPSEEFELKQYQRNLENSKLWYNRYKWLRRLHRYSWFRKSFFPKKNTSYWPYWVSKTNEERIQNIPHVLEQFKDKEVYVTEKIDYQSGTWTGKIVPRFNNWFGVKIFNLINKL
jgi:hypothetical protein